VIGASINCMPLDSRLRGNDEMRFGKVKNIMSRQVVNQDYE